MATFGKDYSTPEARFERRYGSLVHHGHVPDFGSSPDRDTCDGWMDRVDRFYLEWDEMTHPDESLEDFVRMRGIGSSVIEKSAISAEVNQLALSRSMDRRTTSN